VELADGWALPAPKVSGAISAGLASKVRVTADPLESACPEMAVLADLIGSFAQMLAPTRDNEADRQRWIASVREADLPHLLRHRILLG
jgi:hypothetical protein